MSSTRPALLDTPPAPRTPAVRPAAFAWATRRPVLAAILLIATIVLLAIWTGQDPYGDAEDCLARQGTPVQMSATLRQVDCRDAAASAH